jgi:hypothetical protein
MLWQMCLLILLAVSRFTFTEQPYVLKLYKEWLETRSIADGKMLTSETLQDSQTRLARSHFIDTPKKLMF